jgi:redox-sensitive bicupin YhaK (pirin superfamily)
MCQLWINLPKTHKMTKPRYQPILKDQIPTVELPLKTPGQADSEEKKDEPSTPAAKVRLIAGGEGLFEEDSVIKGPAKTLSPVQLWDVILPKAGTHVDIPFPPDQNCIVFVRRGGVDVLSGEDNSDKKQKVHSLGPQDVAVMRMDGSDMLRVSGKSDDTSLLIMGGEPLNEPIAAQGPFVMVSFVSSFVSTNVGFVVVDSECDNLIILLVVVSLSQNTQDELRQAMLDFRSGKF